ncbi:MAG: glycosyltransferase [Candidatus Kapaibacterium sp.]
MRILDLLIIILFFIVGYCFVLYPMVIRLLAKLFPQPSHKDESFRPTISIILAVYNEELVLGRCIESLLALDYPKELLEIIIGSDGSTDRTNEMLEQLSTTYHFIKPLFFPERRGKMPVLNDLVTKATGEILFFADADISLSANTLKVQVRHFADQEIGVVGGAYHIVHDESMKGPHSSEKDYALIQHSIRSNEALFSSTVGVFGGNYMIRRAWWKPLPDPLVHDDTYVAYNIIDRGKRVFFEPESIASEIYSRSLLEEFRRKSRSASRGYHTISYFPRLIGFSGGKNTFLLWSHKLFRWLSPFFISIVFVLCLTGVFLYGDTRYIVVLLGFTAFTLISLVGYVLDKMDINLPLIRQCTWFFFMNLAFVAGTLKFLLKTDEGIWRKATRPANDQRLLHTKEAAKTE